MSVKDAIKDYAEEHAGDVVPFLVRAIPVVVKWWRDRKDRNLDATMEELQRALNERFDRAEQAIRDKHAKDEP